MITLRLQWKYQGLQEGNDEMLLQREKKSAMAPYVWGVGICIDRKKKGMYEVFCWGQ